MMPRMAVHKAISLICSVYKPLDRGGMRPTDYAVGALAIVAVSIAVALIVYSFGILTFEPAHLITWFFGPLGAFTLFYAFARREELVFYAFWGLVMLLVALAIPLAEVGVPLPALIGILILVITIAGLVAYWRERWVK